MRFSERVGLVKPNNVVQINSMSDDLAVGIWNAFYSTFEKANDKSYFHLLPEDVIIIYKNIWTKFYDINLDEIPYKIRGFIKIIKQLYFESSYIDKFDFAQFIFDEIYEFGGGRLFT